MTASRVGVLGSALVLLLVASGCAGNAAVKAHSSASSAPTRPAPDDYAALVLRDGDTVSASGRVVSVPGRPVRFCAPVPESSIGYAPGHDPAPAYCGSGVDVQGVELSTLADRRQKAGAIEGQAQLTGTYAGGTLTVSRQSAPVNPPGRTIPDQPPCAAPAGGWPRGAAGENIDVTAASRYQARHPGVIEQLALLRPSTTQVLAYVVTVGDPAPVVAALRPAFGQRLCVARGRYRPAEIAATARALRIDSPVCRAAGVYSTGSGLTPQGQPEYGISLPWVTPALAVLAGRQPAGLVRFDGWLVPLRR